MPPEFLKVAGLGEEHSRRRFLTNLTFVLSGGIGLLMGIPLLGNLIGPITQEPPDVWQDVGAEDDFELGETKLVSFFDQSSLAWAGETSQTSAWVRRIAPGDLTVWSIHCTHLGCPVSWLPTANLFECPCHGGVYYADGSVAAGPPPRPLFQHQVRVVDGRVQVLTLKLPTA